MPDNDDTPHTFLIGLTMAGAVSAGAYTAGVLDFLLRAMDAHNARCDPGAKDGEAPRHKVALRVISGASAGGVCSGLAVVGLVGDQDPETGRIRAPQPMKSGPDAPYAYDYSYSLGALHSVWVESLDLWRPASQQGFLALDDLADKNEQLQSVLNGRHIDDAADKALSGAQWGREGSEAKPYDILADELDIFLTTTNLMGVPYEVHFTGSDGDPERRTGHKMAQHSAVRHFRVSGLGTHHAPSHWLDRWEDDGIPLDLPTPGGVLPFDDPASTWADFKTSAVATGAFPAGLSPRLIAAEAHDFGVMTPGMRARGGALPMDVDPKADDPDADNETKRDPRRWRHPRPNFGDGMPSTKVHYVAVDGGVANNEPFEFARYTLRKKADPAAVASGGSASAFLAPNAREGDRADRAVIMIDPFPEGPEHVPLSFEEADAERGFLPSLKRLFPTLIDQARFKPDELMNATDQKVHSRFLISPSRRVDQDRAADEAVTPAENAPSSGAMAIASGAFGGFSGFFDHSFRVHDFVLGQRNCQSFLKSYFMLDSSNPVLHPPSDPPKKGAKVTPRPIIDPGPEMLDASIELPEWPRIGNDRLTPLLKQADARLGRVGERLVKQISTHWAFSALVGLAWSSNPLFPGVKERTNNFLIKTVLGEFIRRNQHRDYADLSPAMRELMISLLARGDMAATAEELIQDVWRRVPPEEAPLNTHDVEDALERMIEPGLVWRATSFAGPRRYTHALLKPSLRKRTKLLFGS